MTLEQRTKYVRALDNAFLLITEAMDEVEKYGPVWKRMLTTRGEVLLLKLDSEGEEGK